MSKHLVSMIIISAASMSILVGCNDSDNTTVATTTDEQNMASSDSATMPVSDIDWSLIATNEPPADLTGYDYPFAIDSQNVQDYADYFDVDNATAQYNLTVGMASNEPLSKVLDQLGASYTSHELTDGEDMTLIIHTTADFSASSYDYVFDGDYAKGLTLPIEIVPDGVKSEEEANPHQGM